jgi:ABC-2 type transport system ATP-binding protein
METNGASLRVAGATKRFGEFTAVDALSFEIGSGRVFGFLGPNGAGKTTMIRMIVGITAPDEGTITLFGNSSPSAAQDRIGYLPEERGLYKKMRVLDQLRYFAALKDVPPKEADHRIDHWLSRMGLSEWKRKRTTDLSKGMQQKIQFISTVLHDPDLLILDEPFSGLDPVNVEFLIDVIKEFKSRERTIIFSTHLMETAERLCDDILLINKGKRVLGGTLREVKEMSGAEIIALRAEGPQAVLADPAVVASVTRHADELQIRLAAGVDPQDLLRRLIAEGSRITRFEKIEPSLNDIFIENVKGA